MKPTTAKLVTIVSSFSCGLSGKCKRLDTDLQVPDFKIKFDLAQLTSAPVGGRAA